MRRFAALSLLLLSSCSMIVDQKRLHKEDTHEDIKKLATPPEDFYRPKKERKKICKEAVKIDPVFYKKINYKSY